MDAIAASRAPALGGGAGLVAAAAWAMAGAITARELGLVAAAAAIVLAAVVTTWRRRAGPWLLLVPAALAAIPGQPSPATAPPAGVVRFRGEVAGEIRWDPILAQESFHLAARRQVCLCVVQGRAGVLPGDIVEGIGRGSGPLPPGFASRGLPRILAAHDAIKVRAGRPSPARLAASCRLRMQDALLAAVPGERGLLLTHLVLGKGPTLPEDLVRAHRATGLSHLLAVSGAHATMLAWLLGLLFRAVTGRSPLGSTTWRRAAAGILLLYGVVTGMEPPVFRALVATLLFFCCQSRHRRLPVGAVLALPALLSAVVMPQDLFSVSFNLSYAAVFGLALSGVLHDQTLQGRLLLAPLLGSLWATLTTMPLTLWYFGQFAPWTILATPLLSPLIAMMLGLGLAVGSLGAIAPGLADGLVTTLALPLEGMTFLYCEAVRLVARLPLAPVFAGPRPDLLLLLALGLLGLTLLWVRRNRAAVAVLALLLSLPHFVPARNHRPPGLELLAVGHGLACLLRLPDSRLALIDCGSLGNPARASRAVQEALLPNRRIDLLVLTHGDFDHVGAVPDLLARLPVRRALLQEELRTSALALLLQQQGASVGFLSAGQERRLGPHLLAIRPAVRSGDPNDHSIWLRADLGTFRALLCGDALEIGVGGYLAQATPQTADVIVLPHHGRRHGTVQDLLRVVQPKLALVSSSPKDGISIQATLARNLGVPTLHTGRCGNLRVDATDPPVVHTQRPLPIR